MTGPRVVLAAGLTLIAIAAVLALLHAPSTVAATNGVPRTAIVSREASVTSGCQGGETLPRDTSAVRLGLDAVIGPQVTVTALTGAHVITRGTAGTGWYGSAVTVPVRRVHGAFAHVTVCFGLSFETGDVMAVGSPTNSAVAAVADGETLDGRMRIEYLRRGDRSWWSEVVPTIEHMGLGRAASGTWVVLPIAALVAASIALASWLVVRELG
jgi:hypothetical protein